jgi:adenine-specific DNA-methyltransferase
MDRKRQKRNDAATSVESIRHKDKRPNIPTEELRDFVAEDEKAPKTILYPRDPSLDPQLVWKGKDEQDAKDLAVPVVPIYIQEKIHPQALIENLRDTAKAGEPEPEQMLFADFNGGPVGFDQKVEFYQHEQNWANRMILGDSLLVMSSLAEKEGLKGKVQTIYFDPPYGIKFGSNWQVSTRKRDVKDGKIEDATRQPEQIRAFRDCWRIGIHSYLAYIRDILIVARELLTETGSLFVQIGDENVHLARSVLDEVFGSQNCCGMITVQKTGAQPSELLPAIADYILWYSKDIDRVKYRQAYFTKEAGVGHGSGLRYDQKDDQGRLYQLTSLTSPRPPGHFPVQFDNKTYLPSGGYWKTGPEGFTRLIAARRVQLAGKTLRYKRFLEDFPAYPVTSIWTDVAGSPDKIYVVQTSPAVAQRCMLMTTDPGDLVLDPTCGSGTTAVVAEQWGRRWMTIDTSRVALALARTRLMAAKYPYYLLADSPEGVKKEADLSGKTPPAYSTDGDIRKGFVYKRVPHVTLKSIANNPDLRDGMSNKDIEAAIARHAETETLFDQPYEDAKRIRVSGPFTVESLSPHRVLDSDDEQVVKAGNGESSDFGAMIIENLRKAGVQNTKKNERLTFERLDSFAGAWIHAVGEYAEMPESRTLVREPGKSAAEVKLRRVAISIGPEHGTVGPQQIKEAAKEAVQGVGHDMLIVCGFAFDPHVTEEVKRYGKLTVLPVRMNADLLIGTADEQLLKNTGAGNLFMFFGEPDVEIQKDKDGKLVVEIRGLDVYDPTTGVIRNSTTDDLACWFIDTDYNGESFFVRHAYFTGAATADEGPYDKLKRALRSEIDEAAWSTLYSTKSRPFTRPQTGKIAVKVINHYGDEVLKVFEV